MLNLRPVRIPAMPLRPLEFLPTIPFLHTDRVFKMPLQNVAIKCHGRAAIALLYVILLVAPAAMAAETTATEQIHDAVIAGSWYPKRPGLLRKEIQAYLSQIAPLPGMRRLKALIVPHAGYRYSGQVAAHAYKLLEQRAFDTVVIIAPSHHTRFEGVSVYDRGGYRTPLGIVDIDRELIAAIKKHHPGVRYVPRAHLREHAIEIQLPFLQTTAPQARIVPMVMGETSLAASRKLARALVGAGQDKSMLLIASSDLSHFHSAEKAQILDNTLIRHVRTNNYTSLYRDLSSGACEACGGAPIMTVMIASALMGADDVDILSSANSGDVGGDRSRVVGYMAAAFWASPPASSDTARPPDRLSAVDKNRLLRIARHSIDAHLKGEKIPPASDMSPDLVEKRGAFVTLRRGHRLRGCIGHVVGRLPLARTVSEMAIAAAFKDPRFAPVTPREWPHITIEISVMSPLRQIRDIELITVGRHGIYLRQATAAGLLLPQVALEFGWNRQTFLEQTCRKAGLPPNAWQNPRTDIFIFSADFFSEDTQNNSG